MLGLTPLQAREEMLNERSTQLGFFLSFIFFNQLCPNMCMMGSKLAIKMELTITHSSDKQNPFCSVKLFKNGAKTFFLQKVVLFFF